MSYGWVSIHRQLQEHWLWKDKPFSYGQAWVDMILLANHADNKFPFGNEIVTVETGSFITSELKLMDRWGWSKSKVRRFLSLLETDNMIAKKTDRKKTTITIVNYEDFQFSEPQKDQKKTNKKPIADQRKTDKRPIKDTNNNDNNDNNENNDNKIYNTIVDYLNEKAGTKYKASTKKTQTCIHARLVEGFTVDDFKKVIDKKCADWLTDAKMAQYLRPETLFGTKFESYLNARVTNNKPVNTGVPVGNNQDDLDGLF